MAFDFVPVALAQLWQVTLLIFGVAAINRWVAHRRPHLSHLLWLVVLLKCVTPPLWASSGGVFCWLQPEGQIETTVSAEFETTSANWEQLLEVDTQAVFDTDDSVGEFAGVMVDDAEADELFQASKVLETPEKRSDERGFGEVTFAVWLGVSLLVILGVTVRWLRFWRLVRTSAQRESPELVSLVASLSQQLGVRRRVRLIVTESLVGPAVIGFFRVTVLIPSVVADKLQGKAVAPILAHELLHIRRGDLWVGLLQTLVQAMWWFHPLVWWVGRVTTREAERCCDEEVLGELNCDPASYARALLDVLDLKSQLKPVPVFPGVRPVDVTSQRLERIMTLRQGCRRRSPWWCWLVAIGVAVLTLPGAAFVVVGEDVDPAAASSAALSSNGDVPSGTHAVNTEIHYADEAVSKAYDVDDSRFVQKEPRIMTGKGVTSDAGISGKFVFAAGQSDFTPTDLKKTSAEQEPKRQGGAETSAASLHTGRLIFRHGGCRLEAVPREGSKLDVAIDSDELTVLKAPLTLMLTRTDGFGFTRPIQMQAEQCRISQGDSLKVELSGNVLLTAPQQLIRAKADSLLMTIHADGKGKAEDGIKCLMKNVAMTIQMDPAKDSSLLRAEEISIVLDARTFKTAEISASKVESLRVSDAKHQATERYGHSPFFAEDRQLLSQWDTIRRRRSLQKLVSPKFDRTPLKEAVAWFRTAGDLNIILDELAIEDEGVTGTSPVTLELNEVAIHSALRLLLKPLNLGITIDEESSVVIVTSKLRMQGRMVAAAYPVAGLVIPIPKSVVVRLSDDGAYILQPDSEPRSDEVTLVSGVAYEHSQLDMDSIAELITTAVEPDSWQDVGGLGTLRPNDRTLSLVIRQTREVHREISDLLDQLRRLQNLQVTVRGEVLNVSEEKLDGLKFETTEKSQEHRFAILSKEQAVELRSLGDSKLLPKMTLYNGQKCELLFGEKSSGHGRLSLQPIASADRSVVRLSVRCQKQSMGKVGAAFSALPQVPNGTPVILDLTGSLPSAKPTPGNRTLLLVTSEVVVVEEERLDVLDVDAEPLRR